MNDPELNSQDSDDLDDTERTVEELTEILSTGGVIEVFPSETLSCHVSIAEVAVFVRVAMDQSAVANLKANLPGELHLALPPMEDAVQASMETSVAEMALLARALEARAGLVG